MTAPTPSRATVPRPRWSRRALVTLVTLVTMGAIVGLTGCLNANQTRMIDHINTSRRDAGRATVSANQDAADKAQSWAAHMARTGVVEHTGGGGRVNTSGLPKWCSVGENVGRASSIEALHAAWMRSSSHKANILGNYNRVGTGVVRTGNQVYGIQIFYRAC